MQPGSDFPRDEVGVVTPARPPVLSNRSLVLLVGLLLGSTTINYIDRQVVSVLAPVLRDEFRLSNSQYAGILNAFMIAYMFSYALGGWFIDRLGVGRGLTFSTMWWSVANALTALSAGPVSMGAFRSLLAIGEGGTWPAFAKAVSLWIPANARTLAIAMCNSGSSVGSMIAPPLVVFLTRAYGWRGAFIVTGALGFLWVLAFQVFRYFHPGMRAVDRGRTSRNEGEPALRWVDLIRYRQTWAVFFCRFFADPLWYFYIFWIPEFLVRERGLNLTGVAAVAWIPFLVSDTASFVMGYLVLAAQKRGWSANRTRKTFMLLGTLLSPVGILAAFTSSVAWTLGFISFAVWFFVGWSISVQTLPGDYFPPRAVASVFGIGGTGSTVGSVISIWAVGRTLDLTHSYPTVFVGIGCLMPVACLVGMWLMGRVEPVVLRETVNPPARTSGS